MPEASVTDPVSVTLTSSSSESFSQELNPTTNEITKNMFNILEE
ncbi:MAG: hypothetical protein BWY67_01366 [Bacteroidetes bacterium ADurb.Bin397]|nr:MAG: hypothetical protein BWY67_01366 [Bacteroidetes bacterium ADurb.Bin397]